MAGSGKRRNCLPVSQKGADGMVDRAFLQHHVGFEADAHGAPMLVIDDDRH